MVGCKDNLEKCNANCCKFLVFKKDLMTKDQINYYNLHSNTIVKQILSGFLIIIYRPCSMLIDNKCAINNEKPYQCKIAYEKDKVKNLFVPNCIYKPDKDSIVLTEEELGRLMNEN